MNVAEQRELLKTEGIGMVAYHLCQGGTVTPRSVAAMVGIRPNGGYKMLCRISRVLPVVNDESGWYLVHNDIT